MTRLMAALRGVPRNLRDDLWTTAYDPMPRTGRSSWLDWLPAYAMVLVLASVSAAVVNMNQLAADYGLDASYAVLLGGIQSVALVLALFQPVPAWWAVTIATVIVAGVAEPRAQDVLFPWTGAGLALQAGVLLLLALRVRPRAAVEALAISVLVGLACGTFISRAHHDVGSAAILTAAVVVGAALRGSLRARTKLVIQEELTAEERARRTLLEERNRIARELHDVLAHHMSMISIQAQVAPHLVADPPEELRENLAGIRENAVEALTELRRVLGVLRSADQSEGARHAPQPTLDRLDELVGNVRDAGQTVTTQITGAPRPLSPGVELSAFRIVQEALSNVIRHAPGTEARVDIRYQPDALTIRVVNTAPDEAAPPSRAAGHGLLGMRERTTMLGGELAVGPTPDGGYEVTAILPATQQKPG
ncbi:two-component sensor histidine kinase [Acrocarpospora corrugata]|uniref:histidine kinase n=1 Tax=Acrocarpospora corrugata TaxID=35763 RepID=A0A5M3WDX7_9ACTN|nr:sensor histidine kinase [Acrocarpospora corrugata]GES06282.1 two-component sensor histidine kinase [Acrocarpospora corrugata]